MKKTLGFILTSLLFIAPVSALDDKKDVSDFNDLINVHSQRLEDFEDKESDGTIYVDGGGIMPRMIVTKKLSVNRVEQQNGYYCGPASVKMILDYRGIVYSQNTIANALGTKNDGKGTSADSIAKYLKSKTGFNYLSVTLSQKPLSYVTQTIDKGYPVVYNVKGSELPGYGANMGGHHIVGHGYTYNSQSLPEGGTGKMVVDLLYLDPYYASYAKGEKRLSLAQMTRAVRAQHSKFVW